MVGLRYALINMVIFRRHAMWLSAQLCPPRPQLRGGSRHGAACGRCRAGWSGALPGVGRLGVPSGYGARRSDLGRRAPVRSAPRFRRNVPTELDLPQELAALQRVLAKGGRAADGKIGAEVIGIAVRRGLRAEGLVDLGMDARLRHEGGDHRNHGPLPPQGRGEERVIGTKPGVPGGWVTADTGTTADSLSGIRVAQHSATHRRSFAPPEQWACLPPRNGRSPPGSGGPGPPAVRCPERSQTSPTPPAGPRQ